MRNRILFDSCIVVAASVLISSADLGIELKHHFYEQAMLLFSLIRNNLSKRIGVVTATIENEALRVLNQVVRGEIRAKYEKVDKEKLFKYHSIALNVCDTRMRNLLALLQREPIESDKAAVWHMQVANMYAELEEKARGLEKTAALKVKAVPKRIRRMADWFEIYRTNDQRRHAQLLNLLHKKIETEDMTILAEACYLLNLYKQIGGKDVQLVIASTDHHFSPVRRRSWAFESRQVTNEIEKRFRIICNWPDTIYDYVLKRL